MLVLALIDALWIGAGRVSLAPAQLAGPVANMALLGLMALAAGRIAWTGRVAVRVGPRLADFLQGMVFLQISWIALRVFNHLGMATAIPYADNMLAAWDAALGFDWMGYFTYVQTHPRLLRLLDIGYSSLTPVSFVGFVLLAGHADPRRGRYFLETFFLTAIICTGIGMGFPARAAVAHYFGYVAGIPGFASVPGVYHLEHLLRLRGPGPVALDLANLPGLVTFPSFHTAAGVILVAAFFRTALFPAVLAYSVVMIAATPVFGGHYFVDLIAGAAVAAVVLGLVARLRFYEGLFAADGAAAPVFGSSGTAQDRTPL